MKNTMDLHVETIARMRGGRLTRSKPPVIDSLGLVSLMTYNAGEKMYNLEPGNYLITFQESLPQDIIDAGYVAWTDFNQPDLIRMGMHLDINFQPFCGFLMVGYPTVIEHKSRFGSFSWEILYNEEDDLPESSKNFLP